MTAGIPAQAFTFLGDLALNNSTIWFNSHRQTYEEALLEPARHLVAEVGAQLQARRPSIRFDTRANGAGSLTRIHRDIRFSADKSPFHAHLSGLFWEGAVKKNEAPAFGFRIMPEGIGVLAGMFHFPDSFTPEYRRAVADNGSGPDLEAVLAEIRTAGPYAIGGERYARVPAGYDATHPRAELLKQRGLFAHLTTPITPEAAAEGLATVMLGHFERMAPLQQWLAEVSLQGK